MSTNSLPTPLTSFVGRADELAALRDAVTTMPLLTVTGPGGCGKTRLAQQAAFELEGAFPDGVYWVELASLADEALVGAAVAEALGVRPLPEMTDVQAVCAFLASQRVLLVLDNCEHLLGACAEVAAELLKAAPGLTLLATSRALLGVASEADWRVPPLSGADAAALFVARARPGLEATDEVATICAHLDGLPLAIELAAARLRLLSIEQLAERLSDRLALLTRGPRTAVARQQTLRASIDWSYDLLGPDEQRLLRQVAVFTGSFSLEAAEAVCDGTLDLLGSLVDQSLVIAEPHARAMRYRLLETVREYGLERLADAASPIRDRHLAHFLTVAEEAAPELESPRVAEWLRRLEPDAANFAAAIDHAVASDPAAAMRLCAAVYPFWRARGRLAEAARAQSRALAAGHDAEPELRARVLITCAARSVGAGDPEAAYQLGQEALALAGESSTAARARCEIGKALQFSRPAHARNEFARATTLARESGDDRALIHAHLDPAFATTLQNDHAATRRLIDAIAEIVERAGEPYNLARLWGFVGFVAVNDGRLADAYAATARGHAALAGVWEPLQEGAVDAVEALTDVWTGRHARALERVPRQLARAVRVGAAMPVPFLMSTLAFAELAAGRLEASRSRLEQLAALFEGRHGFISSWALNLLAETQRLLGDATAAGTTARRALTVSEEYGNRLLATRARLTLARLAAARQQWPTAQAHALAHLDACAEGGHLTWVPGCLDALGEIAAGIGRNDDAARLLAAAARARRDTGVARVIPEPEHWKALEQRVGDAPALTIDEALEWARRARGPRTRPAAGWAALTPTEVRVVGLVAQGLTNPQIAEQMFISRDTVKTHLAHAFAKLGVRNRTELAALAARAQ